MTERKPRYWFGTKRYGWGWGLPFTWEGWVVLGVWFIGLLAVVVFIPQQNPWFWICLVALTLGLLAVCLRKGEPPRWRWGGD